MQAPTSPSKTPLSKPMRRRNRSEADRKKHAGWRRCLRCATDVSTNGRNYLHHMQKCDPNFFAEDIARYEASRAAPAPSPQPQTARLTDAQRVIFLQQLCFLRIYDRTVDNAFRRLEAEQNRVCDASVFKTVRNMKEQRAANANISAPESSPPLATQRPPYGCSTIPLPDALASPMSAPAASTVAPAAEPSTSHMHSVLTPVFPPPANPGSSNYTPRVFQTHPSMPCSSSTRPVPPGPAAMATPTPLSATGQLFKPQCPPATHVFAHPAQTASHGYRSELDASTPMNCPPPSCPVPPPAFQFVPHQPLQNPQTGAPPQSSYQEWQRHVPSHSVSGSLRAGNPGNSGGPPLHAQPQQGVDSFNTHRDQSEPLPSSSRPASAMSISSVINN